MSSGGDSLDERLSNSLPANDTFKYYHISTPPTKSAALFSAPPGCKPETTYCESHFLLVSTLPDADASHEIAVFAIEILVYSTATLTTLFVSKADSTGWLSLLNLPRSSESPIRSITTQFVSFLAREHHRPNRRLVISLFARSQETYLFPGSPENVKKHILDDRQLVKWWCRSLDPVVREYPHEGKNGLEAQEEGIRTKAYLIVPGHDDYETRPFFPPSLKDDAAGHKRWVKGHPLYKMSSFPHAPPRCIIPHFPDDPKTRFLLDLDDEIRDTPTGQAYNTISPSKRGAGQWKSVRSVDQFWEMMAYRTECSSGRLVGFIWITFTAPPRPRAAEIPNGRTNPSTLNPKSRKVKLPTQRPMLARKRRVSRKLRGPIIPRAPRVKSVTVPSNSATPHPEKTRFYYSPKSSRGMLVLTQKGYTRLNDLLLRLDFANIDVARSGTAKWAREAGVIAGTNGQLWGKQCVGRKITAVPNGFASSQNVGVRADHSVNTLTVKKKRKAEESNGDDPSPADPGSSVTRTDAVLMDMSTVRKKPKVDDDKTHNVVGSGSLETGVQLLGGALLRKKAKAG